MGVIKRVTGTHVLTNREDMGENDASFGVRKNSSEATNNLNVTTGHSTTTITTNSIVKSPPRLEDLPQDKIISSHPNSQPKDSPNMPPSLVGGEREHRDVVAPRNEAADISYDDTEIFPEIEIADSRIKPKSRRDQKHFATHDVENILQVLNGAQQQNGDIYSIIASTLASDSSNEDSVWKPIFSGYNTPPSFDSLARRDDIPLDFDPSFVTDHPEGSIKIIYDDGKCKNCWGDWLVIGLLVLPFLLLLICCAICSIKHYIQKKIKERAERKADSATHGIGLQTSRTSIDNPTQPQTTTTTTTSNPSFTIDNQSSICPRLETTAPRTVGPATPPPAYGANPSAILSSDQFENSLDYASTLYLT
ncbi:hypothetical protein B7463_g11273, partial [Scytalidium lignicola]